MELIETRGPQEATEAARQASSGEVDVVVVVGGDGRVMEAAGGLINRRLPLAIIPAGTQPVISEYEHTSDP